MQKPDEFDHVVCPNSGANSKATPEEVWDGAPGPDGKPRRYGIIPKHSHGFTGEECEYTGLPMPVVREEKKKTSVLGQIWVPS